jgi:hypothetical protein
MILLGTNLLRQEKWMEVETVLREWLSIQEKTKPDTWDRFNARSLLGGSLLGQGKYDEAEPLIVTGYEGMKALVQKTHPHWKPWLTEAALRVVRLYEAWGKPGEATEWKAKLGLSDLPADVFAR